MKIPITDLVDKLDPNKQRCAICRKHFELTLLNQEYPDVDSYVCDKCWENKMRIRDDAKQDKESTG